MRRRDFITGIAGSAAVSPLAARAQQSDRMRRIGVLMAYAESDREGQTWVAAFRDALQNLGWTQGRNIRMDTRWSAADTEAMQRIAKELVTLQPDLILTQNTPTTAAVLQQTRTIPIIFGNVGDPVGQGFVASFSRPGGNLTGFTLFEPTMAGKWLELLKQVAPGVTRAAVLRDAAIASGIGQFAAVQAVAPSLGVELSPVDARDAPEIERASTVQSPFLKFPFSAPRGAPGLPAVQTAPLSATDGQTPARSAGSRLRPTPGRLI